MHFHLLLLGSIALQLSAAVVAWRAGGAARSPVGWRAVSAALALMALRRGVTLARLVEEGSDLTPDPLAETIAASISALMLFGLWHVRGLLARMGHEGQVARADHESIRLAEERWRRLFEFAPDGYVLLGSDRTLRRINRAAAAMVGRKPEELEGGNLLGLGLIDETDWAGVVSDLRASGREGLVRSRMYPVRRADGDLRRLEVSAEPLVEGEETLVLTILRDVTERQRTEEELRRSKVRLEEAQQAAGLMTWEFDVRGSTMWISGNDNPLMGAAGRGGASLAEILETIHPQDRAVVASLLSRAAEGAAGDLVAEYRQRRTDGAYIIVRTVCRGDYDESGSLLRLLGASFDVTEIRGAERAIRALNNQLEERVRRRTAELEDANAELEAFSYSVSHDLRTPLRALAGYSRAVLEDNEAKLDSTSRVYLERIDESAVRMGSMIEGLLELSRLSRRQVVMRAVDLAEMARAAVEELRAGEPGREVVMRIDATLPAWGDPSMLQLLVANLLGSAWKFTRRTPGAAIEMTSTTDGGFLVRDNGVGFDSANAARLFQPFQRQHDHGEFEGSGIGLATVERVLRRHGGRIEVDSAAGRGAEFRFWLSPVPAADAADPDAA